MPFITTTHLAGNLSGTFYLDDVRLVTGIPAAPPVEPPPVTAVLEERSEVSANVGCKSLATHTS